MCVNGWESAVALSVRACAAVLIWRVGESGLAPCVSLDRSCVESWLVLDSGEV